MMILVCIGRRVGRWVWGMIVLWLAFRNSEIDLGVYRLRGLIGLLQIGLYLCFWGRCSWSGRWVVIYGWFSCFIVLNRNICFGISLEVAVCQCFIPICIISHKGNLVLLLFLLDKLLYRYQLIILMHLLFLVLLTFSAICLRCIHLLVLITSCFPISLF